MYTGVVEAIKLDADAYQIRDKNALTAICKRLFLMACGNISLDPEFSMTHKYILVNGIEKCREEVIAYTNQSRFLGEYATDYAGQATQGFMSKYDIENRTLYGNAEGLFSYATEMQGNNTAISPSVDVPVQNNRQVQSINSFEEVITKTIDYNVEKGAIINTAVDLHSIIANVIQTYFNGEIKYFSSKNGTRDYVQNTSHNDVLREMSMSCGFDVHDTELIKYKKYIIDSYTLLMLNKYSLEYGIQSISSRDILMNEVQYLNINEAQKQVISTMIYNYKSLGSWGSCFPNQAAVIAYENEVKTINNPSSGSFGSK